ncbi:unnamed protein product [Mesocestoides corti]|uniref:FHF complex subunit HOOK-interacting protein C-terminal domain-containing protein n=1 Tax=Mesocestoides corti TaxID=53468 RepID=A0A3P6HSE9_MESCO|nr:unnamed protein product [Mesocestoides corti]
MLQSEKFIVQSELGKPIHALFDLAIEMKLFEQLNEMLGRFHGDKLETLKEACLQFYEDLITCPFYALFLKEEQAQATAEDNAVLGTKSKDIFWSVCLNPQSHVRKSRFCDPNKSVAISDKPSMFKPSEGSQIAFTNNYSSRPSKIQPICDLLVTYVRHDGSLSWLSRDALLLLVATSAADENAGFHMANNSNLCEVLVTDMVLLFNRMPQRLATSNCIDQWPSLLQAIKTDEDHYMHNFLDHFEFCRSILDISNYLVKKNMLDCLYRGFLLPVLAPGLLVSSEPALATATIYLERILKESKGSILLPFILRFLFSEPQSQTPKELTSHNFWLGVTQALEQSFPLSEASFYHGMTGSISGTQTKSYMDVLLKRIQYCNTLVGVATLSLMNTIVDLLCEDVAFELMLRYLIPLANDTALKVKVSTPESFFASANEYLALIPPYSSITPHPHQPLTRDNDWCIFQNGDLSSSHIDDGLFARLDAQEDAARCYERSTARRRILGYLREARNLLNERKAACSAWRFPYDFDSPTLAQASNAQLSENLCTPLPQEGLPVVGDPFDATTREVVSGTRGDVLYDRSQWELDGLAQVMAQPTAVPPNDEEDSILADLERFSALLRDPPPTRYLRRTKSHANSRRHRSQPRPVPDPDEVKRTSSLYDISFIEMDVDETSEGAAPSSPPPPPSTMMPDRMTQSVDAPLPLASSASSDLSLTESTTHQYCDLPAGVEAIGDGGIPALLLYLDKIPDSAAPHNDVEERFARCISRFDKEKKPEAELDSGFSSVDSGRLKPTVLPDSETVDSPTFNPGPFLATLMQLVSHIPNNHLYANLLITRLVTQVMALPLPLTRVLLLTTGFWEPQVSVVRPYENRHGGQLYSILLAVRQWFDCYINLYFPRAFNHGPEESNFASLANSVRMAVFSDTEAGSSICNGLYSEPLRRVKKKSWIAGLLQKKSGVNALPAEATVVVDRQPRVSSRPADCLSVDAFNLVKDEKSHNLIISLLIFEEFCQELAALCMEHGVNL